jgi:hypothetical protein
LWVKVKHDWGVTALRRFDGEGCREGGFAHAPLLTDDGENLHAAPMGVGPYACRVVGVPGCIHVCVLLVRKLLTVTFIKSG